MSSNIYITSYMHVCDNLESTIVSAP